MKKERELNKKGFRQREYERKREKDRDRDKRQIACQIQSKYNHNDISNENKIIYESK